MSKTVIKIENLSKIYRLGEVGTGTISHDLNRFWKMNILGKDDPYAKIGHLNDRTAKAEKGELVAALHDINLEVKEGEVLGIIGKNGAGKSTLLKILSRVTSPTTGSIKVKGRMASLLEVGTGFHPEMTGRENIYMNGTIMGMRRWEIDKQFDAIVDFAGIAKYVDTPVKRYSSGMTVRLGFAIAAHLEPEILVVDEVLAVGDAEFQKKAIGKMQDVSKNDGRTVLFVSHNMAAVQSLCSCGILMQNGIITFKGDSESTINQYLTSAIHSSTNTNWSADCTHAPHNEFIRVLSVSIDTSDKMTVKNSLTYNIKFEVLKDNTYLNLSSHLFNIKGDCIFNVVTNSKFVGKGIYKGSFIIPGNLLNDDYYNISTLFVQDRSKVLLNFQESVSFEVLDERSNETWFGKWQGMIRPTNILYDFTTI